MFKTWAVCFLWLKALLWLRSTNLRSKFFSEWMNLWLFHCIYGQHVFNDMHHGCIRNSCPTGPFLLIRDTMIKWLCSCWLLYSRCLWAAAVCTSRSKHQVSHCDTCVCLRWWYNCVGLLPLVAAALKSMWLCLFLCTNSMQGGRSILLTTGTHGEQRSNLKRKSILILKSLTTKLN